MQQLRKNILKYDDVVNVQRKEIFSQRRNIMETADVTDMFENIYMDVVEDIIVESIPEGSFVDQWDVSGLEEKLEQHRRRTTVLKRIDRPAPLRCGAAIVSRGEPG